MSVVNGLTFCVLECFIDMKMGYNETRSSMERAITAILQEDFRNTTLVHGNCVRYFSEVEID